MKCILYSSQSKLGNIDINHLLESAVKKNARLNITGFLISHSAGFIQFIEGNDAEINELYAVIEKDQRHSNVTKILDVQTEKRIYQEWNMGHVYIDDDKIIKMLIESDSLKWFEFLKDRTLFLYPHDFKLKQEQLEKN